MFVCTPPLTHREIAVTALHRGIHVYLEKPIARGLEDARAIVDAAARAPTRSAPSATSGAAIEALDDAARGARRARSSAC